jgi:hypothetical protein
LIHIFLTSAQVGGEWEASRPGHFTSEKKALPPGTHCIGGWVGPRAGAEAVEKRKRATLPGLELRPLGRPAHIAVAIPTALYWLPHELQI